MNDIWIPIAGPPLVDNDTKESFLEKLHEGEARNLTKSALPLIHEEHWPFGRFIDGFGQDLNRIADGEQWPEQALKIGAALAIAAYRESGYYQVIDVDAFGLGTLYASLSGVPDTYFMSLNSDLGLNEVVVAASKDPELQHFDGIGILQAISIGAGSARHYLQQAIAA